MNKNKMDLLIDQLKDMKRVVIAFSGGVDSTFLLKAAHIALGDDVLAVTVASPYIPKWEVEEAKALTEKLGIAHHVMMADIPEIIKNNPEDRCYLCKGIIFNKIKAYAFENGYNAVADGTNFDDTKDYRPGLRALEELDIKSPLKACGLTKMDIRNFSKALALPTWDKPAYACLLTRIPYNVTITEEELTRIETAETFMMRLGFKAVRVRSHGDLARIEVDSDARSRLFDVQLWDEISAFFKSNGYQYVTVDLEGYRMGSFNGDLSND